MQPTTNTVNTASCRDHATTRHMALSTPSNPDAGLIRLCNELLAVNAEEAEILAIRTTIAIENATDHLVLDIYRREKVLVDKIYDAPRPTTLPGLRAMATAALAINPDKDADGACNWSNHDELLSLLVLESLESLPLNS